MKIKTQFSKLVKTLSDKGWSFNTITKVSEVVKGMTKEQREIKSGQMLSILQKVTTEEQFCSMIKEI